MNNLIELLLSLCRKVGLFGTKTVSVNHILQSHFLTYSIMKLLIVFEMNVHITFLFSPHNNWRDWQ
jgi:hypothetical protein